MITKVKKLWLGHASVRDYVVKKAIDQKEDLVIEVGGVMKTYPYKSLKTHLLNNNKTTFKSKYGSGEYTLIDFPWTSPAY